MISPCRASISSVQGLFFLATAGWHFSRDLTRHLLIGGYGQSTSMYLFYFSEKNFLLVNNLDLEVHTSASYLQLHVH